MNMADIAKQTKKTTAILQAINEAQRIKALENLAQNISQNVASIIVENQKDIKLAQEQHLPGPIIERLTLNAKNLQALSASCLAIAKQDQVVGIITEVYKRPNGLQIEKQRMPLGVIGMIFESRPNVVIDSIALAIKSGNAIILKGGKEAHHSNIKLFQLAQQSIDGILPKGCIQLLTSRGESIELLKCSDSIDLMVARGGSELIKFVKKNATMPVVAHDKGLCHLYLHHDYESETAVNVILNAKISRPGVCNALESLLIHENFSHQKLVIEKLIEAGVQIRGCSVTQKLSPLVIPANPGDYDTEYLDKIISVKIVKTLQEGIEHIKTHSSHHTEAILSHNPIVIEDFLNSLDSSCLVINASTRFNDGSELGLGAELGISTSKLHAYGPMGTKEMTCLRFVVRGNGQIR